MSISLNDLIFSYDQTAPLLNIPSWEVEQGEKVFLKGASGSGKSTLLQLLAGLLSPQSGNINVFGTQLDTLNQRQRDQFRAENIGYIFQQFNLIPYLSAFDNVLLSGEFGKSNKQENQSRARELLTQLQLPEYTWQQQGRLLSIGQQQRVAIARALLSSPKLLIADEPTSALDEDNRDAFMRTLMELADTQNSTLIFVSHDARLADYFDRTDNLSDLCLSQSDLNEERHNVL
ncbi:ABC transporter ATP-binding protein [Thalassolituus sp.]|uniref:ABC transporter ATP-binding protein n=1 Tax=Thalassolituus sp. TaxID=2030822 RepID=UPI00351592B5